jgi:hypothetical protein
MDWLDVQLSSFRQRGMQVWLTGHVPPHAGNCTFCFLCLILLCNKAGHEVSELIIHPFLCRFPDFGDCWYRYGQLSLRYQDTIVGHTFGHVRSSALLDVSLSLSSLQTVLTDPSLSYPDERRPLLLDVSLPPFFLPFLFSTAPHSLFFPIPLFSDSHTLAKYAHTLDTKSLLPSNASLFTQSSSLASALTDSPFSPQLAKDLLPFDVSPLSEDGGDGGSIGSGKVRVMKSRTRSGTLQGDLLQDFLDLPRRKKTNLDDCTCPITASFRTSLLINAEPDLCFTFSYRHGDQRLTLHHPDLLPLDPDLHVRTLLA